MGDKEPRRRKKNRRDSQKKEDVRSDDQFFVLPKSESKDSDQEVEEVKHHVIHHHNHQPSNVAKFVFVILFSGLVVSLSFIFISLHDADRGPADIFGHNDHGEVLHGGEQDEVLHEEHVEEALQDDHHDQEEEKVRLEDLISGLSSFLSFGSDQVEETENSVPSEDAGETDKQDSDDVRNIIPESLTDQGILEEYIEETPAQLPPVSIVEPAASKVYPETTTSTPYSVEETLYTYEYSEPEYVLTPTMSPDELDDVEPDDEPTTVTTNGYESEDDEIESFSVYDRVDITNEADFLIREQLDDLDEVLEKSPEKALTACEELLNKYPASPRLHYLKAQALDSLAESHRSNKHLEEAIAAFQKTMLAKNVPDKLYLLAGKRAADRLRFRGFTGKSVKLLTEMSNKFPLDIDLKNQAAVGYLLIGQNKLAKKVLLEVLKIAPHSGVAKVHLGFILKTDESKYEESIKYLSEGIASREHGVIDGRFFFHLGDALHRSGKKDEAMKVYEEAVKEGLFFSVYQRSLYNVNGLTGKPWWDPQKNRYTPDFKILERNWVTIRDEALSLIDQKNSGFVPEAEGLQDKGDWKQFELFARGRKLEKNCLKAPKTCALISQIPDAASCKRGQVKFSIMHAGTHVWAHTGPTNCRLRAHLGLVIPEGVSIRVADETRKWEEGKVILFDDSFEHEVWHNGSTYRMILIVDFWHPELTAYQKRSLTPI